MFQKVYSAEGKYYLNVLMLSAFVLFSCNDGKKLDPDLFEHNTKDTVVGFEDVSTKIPGSAYVQRATEYYLIVGNDTSDFRPVFKESKEDARISFSLNLSYLKNKTTHKQRLEELKHILSSTALDYNMDSLKGIGIGRLAQTGDLAINVTEEYLNEFGTRDSFNNSEYKQVSEFLKRSQLGRDFNRLLEPFHLSIESIRIEKLWFSRKNELLRFGAIEKDTAEIPDRLLDCSIGLGIAKGE